MLGKPPTLDPSMEDGAVAAPLPTPPVVGRVPVAAELPPRPRERAVSAEPPPRPRERESRRRREATATEGTGWGRRRRIQRRRCGCLLLPSCGRHGHLESARWRWMRRIGGTGMRRRYGGWRWIGRGKLPRAPKSSACARHRLLPVGSERAVASRRRGRTTEPPPSLPPRSTGEGRRLARGAAKQGVSCKKAHHGDGKKTPLYMPLRASL